MVYYSDDHKLIIAKEYIILIMIIITRSALVKNIQKIEIIHPSIHPSIRETIKTTDDLHPLVDRCEESNSWRNEFDRLV